MQRMTHKWSFFWVFLRVLLWLGCLGQFFLAGSLHAAVYDREDPARGDRVAAFRLFVPDEVKTVRAVMVLVPGLDGDGRGMAGDPEWREFAARNSVALLAVFFRGRYYYRAESWTGKALLKNLEGFAAQSAHPELMDAPLAFWGHSAGGQFNYNFACFRPERTLAFVANKGANYEAQPDGRVRAVPGLWITGDD